MQKRILVVCFTFPPYSGIGGRRWSKFIKYLYRNGCEVKVLAARKIKTKDSAWQDDILEYTSHIEYLPINYPLILTQNPSTLFQKISYKMSLLYVKLRTLGNYFDHSSLWGKELLDPIEREIKRGIENVIVTCGPFAMSGLVINLKKKYPHVNFIVDFRDPWTDNKTSFGYTSISSRRLEVERRNELNVVSSYDYVITVSAEMTARFKEMSRANNSFITVKNGFDFEDLKIKKGNNIQGKDSKLRFVFTGTLYHKAVHVFEALCNGLKTIKNSNSHIYNDLEFDFYGDTPQVFISKANGVEIIKFHGEIQKDKVYEVIEFSHVGMLFLTDDLNYTFSTKFYEYVLMETPIAVFSKGGATGNYVKENKLGYDCKIDSIKETILDIYSDWKAKIITRNKDYDISAHSVESIALNQLLPLLK